MRAFVVLVVSGLAVSPSLANADPPTNPTSPGATAGDGPPGPDLTVAADGSGRFKTVQEAVASIPRENRERVVIFLIPVWRMGR